MRISQKASLSILLALTLSSCQSLQSEATNQSTGALLGGIAGGLLGAQVGEGKGRVAAAAIGAAIGALAGSAVGAKLDERSTGLASNAVKTSYTAPLGTQITWSNPNNSAASTWYRGSHPGWERCIRRLLSGIPANHYCRPGKTECLWNRLPSARWSMEDYLIIILHDI